MKFSGHEIPGSLFKAARDRMLAPDAGPNFTPGAIRQYLLNQCRSDLAAISSIEVNQAIIADRVFQEARRQLLSTGEVMQIRRGVWAPVFKR